VFTTSVIKQYSTVCFTVITVNIFTSFCLQQKHNRKTKKPRPQDRGLDSCANLILVFKNSVY